MNVRRNVPIVEGAITRNGNTRRVDPARRMFTWSMWVAPAMIAHSIVNTFRPGDAAPGWVESRRTHSLINAFRPSFRISVPTRIIPAFDIEFGSSKSASIRSMLCEDVLTESAFRNGCLNGVENRHSSSPGGTFRGRAHLTPPGTSVDQGSGPEAYRRPDGVAVVPLALFGP